MGRRENGVETHFKNEWRRIGGITRKFVSPGHVGVPDQIAILNSLVWFVEIKPEGENLAPWQEREHKRLRDAGANVITLYGHAEVDDFIHTIYFEHIA